MRKICFSFQSLRSNIFIIYNLYLRKITEKIYIVYKFNFILYITINVSISTKKKKHIRSCI